MGSVKLTYSHWIGLFYWCCVILFYRAASNINSVYAAVNLPQKNQVSRAFQSKLNKILSLFLILVTVWLRKRMKYQLQSQQDLALNLNNCLSILEFVRFIQKCQHLQSKTQANTSNTDLVCANTPNIKKVLNFKSLLHKKYNTD